MNCKHCGHILDDGVTRCPKCGQDTKNPINGTKLAVIIVSVILALCVIGGIIWAVARPAESDPTEPTNDPSLSNPANDPTGTGSTEATEYVPTAEDLEKHPVLSRDTFTGNAGDTAALDEVIATVGDASITNGQFAIWYWQTYYDLVNQLGYYASIYGLDTTQPLSEQECAMSEVPMTWEQFLVEQSLMNWHSYQSLYLEAKANGLTLSEEDQATLDSLEAEMTASAQANGFDNAAAMLEADYGEGITLDDYKFFMETLMLGNQYYTERSEALQPTDEEVDAFYQEHTTDYIAAGILQDGTPSTVNVRHILIKPEEAATNDGDETTATEETLSAEEQMEICRTEAQAILDQWKAGEATEESFAALATEYTEDSGSKTTGGLYENVTPGQMIAEFNDWCFDPDRKPGDTDLVQTDYGIHIMYFVSASETEYWYLAAQSDLVTERLSNLVSETAEKYTLTADYAKILLTPVEMAAIS